MAEFLKGDDIDVYGINFHYDVNERIFLYAGAIDFQSDTKDTLDDESITYYLGTDMTFGGLNIQGEFAKQVGDESIMDVDRDAEAGFAFLKYTFQNVAMTPFVEFGGYFSQGMIQTQRTMKGLIP